MASVAVVPRTARARTIRRHVFIYLGLMPFLVIAVFPIFWMAITAIKQDADLYLVDAVPFWFRQAPTWKNFDFLFHNTSYGDWIVNTMAISFWVSVITILTAVPAGYALARLRLPGAENLGIGIFMTYLVGLFSAQFTQGVQDRYLFFLVVPMFVGCVAWLSLARPSWWTVRCTDGPTDSCDSISAGSTWPPAPSSTRAALKGRICSPSWTAARRGWRRGSA